MRAIAMTGYDSGVGLHELPRPEPAPDELLVRVKASSVNRIDVLVAGGVLKGMMEYEFPAVPGRDFAGTVEQVGSDASRFEVGDDVFGFLTKPTVHEGAWAEYVTVPEDGFVARKPSGLGFTEAAALPLAGVTALVAVDAVDPHEDDTVLVVGADGGVGSYAVQLAAKRGATVIATAKPDDEQRLRELGAVETIDWTQQNLAAAVRERHPDGVNALIDLVNQAKGFAPLAELVRDGGRAASSLGAADEDGLAGRNIPATNVMASADASTMARLAKLVTGGEVKPAIEAVLTFAQTPAAIEQFTAGKRGKIVISLADER
ncbi:MAG TPA: NADP-dependent oxidoreductase [Gaiellaceae bacterium]|nr:NADP-dependent oxidoreductase [Gaiellaceae bacterium]